MHRVRTLESGARNFKNSERHAGRNRVARRLLVISEPHRNNRKKICIDKIRHTVNEIQLYSGFYDTHHIKQKSIVHQYE